MLIPLDEILGTADDIANVYFVDVDVEYTDPIEIEAGCCPLCPEFREVDKRVFTDFVKNIMLHNHRLSNKLICNWTDKNNVSAH